MKTLVSWFNGAVTVTWDGSNAWLNFDESVGGGAAAGIVKGQGSIALGVMQGVELGEQDLNKILPAAVQPIVAAIEAVANPALASAI